jgi:DNA topoisomerase-1
MSNLVIVESPAKARTIGTYLGKDYTVKATMGHIRDLPKSGKGVDVSDGFKLNYQTIEGKEGTIDELKKAAVKAESVFLATDPDREGEAISWHLKEVLGLDDSRARRVTFNEITKREVQRSIKSPREIDYQLVDAQQARRALDRIVGYEVSPVLWKKIKGGLSAGRVQSVACRMVVDREEEIRAFKPEEYWTVEVSLERKAGPGGFLAQYFGPKGGKKRELANREEASAVVGDVKDAPFSVLSVTHSERKRSPAPPFP